MKQNAILNGLPIALLAGICLCGFSSPALAQLPSPWQNQDIGAVGVAGSSTYANGTWTLQGAGADIAGTSDAFQYTYEPAGDGTIIAHLTSLQCANQYWPKSGVMFRETTNGDSINVFMAISATNGAVLQIRSTTGGSTDTSRKLAGVAPPYWVKLTRSGGSFSGYVSPDGTNWTQVGTSVAVTMNASAYAGMAVCAHSTSTLNTSTFDNVSAPPPPYSGPPVSDIYWTNTIQRIDGFGAGVVFLDAGLDPLTSANLDNLFGTNGTEFGLSLLRIRISSDGNDAANLADAQGAVARGARVMATPWSPPAYMKNNDSIVGGSLLTNDYAAYASYLNDFATTCGVQLAAISIQNEPDINVTYESCNWTSNQLQTFCHYYAGAITAAPVMMPESYDYNFNMSDPTLNDPVAAANVAIIGGHLYGATIQDYPLAHSLGKPTWMTEYLVNDQTWPAALATAEQIYNCLTVANMSAYIWWKTIGDANGLLSSNGVPQPRGYVMAQFSRFVRPGDYRIGTLNQGSSLLVTAFKNPATGDFAIVAINGSSNAITQTFNLDGITPTSVTPWITSSTLSLASQTPIAVNNSSFTATIQASNVVTFVGSANATAPPPSAPTGLAAAGGNAIVNLTWTQSASPGITGNNVYRSTSGSGGPYNLLANLGPATSYSDTAVTAGNTYFYSVTAINTNGESALSAYSGATTVPPAPTGLAATAGNNQVALSWTASTGATSYNVKRATVSGGPYTTIAGSVTTTSYTDTTATNGTTYYYVVSAVNGSGESANSSAVSATPSAPPPPNAPTNLTATAGNNQVALSWTASTGATSYNVKRATVSGGPYTTIAGGVTTTSYTDTTAVNGTTYYYVVSAVNGNGESANSSEVSATPSAPLAPTAPTTLTASSKGRKQIQLNWTQSTSSNLADNNVYRSTTSGGPYTLVATLSPTTSYRDHGLSSGTTYYYVVTAVDNNGLESTYSNQAGATAQ